MKSNPTIQYLIDVALRLIVYGSMLVFLVYFWLSAFRLLSRAARLFVLCLALAILLPPPRSPAADVATDLRWVVNMEDPEPYEILIRRGETIDLTTYWRNNGVAKNLSAANTVTLYYRPYGETNVAWHYSATGSVTSATGGVTTIRWAATNEASASKYSYDIVVSAFDTTMVRGKGIIRLESTMATGTNTTPRQYDVIDFAIVELLNVGLAPFLSSYDTSDFRDFMNSCGDGTADLSINSITSTVPYFGSAANLSDFPAYLARTNGLLPNTITNVAKGVDEAVGRIERTGEHSVSVHFPIVGEGEIATTNRLYWVVDGVAVGYVSTNGITMLHGSLQLYEEDLNCNVRAYDGSVNAPSLSFMGSPTVGWYRKSVGGSHAWAYAHNSNDVAYIDNDGWHLMGTRTYDGYGASFTYVNVDEGVRVADTNGMSTNLTVVTGILTNGSGQVTGTVTRVLNICGGVILP